MEYSSQSAASWINNKLPKELENRLNPTNLTYILDGMLEYIDMECDGEMDEVDFDVMLDFIVYEFLSGENDIELTAEDLKVIQDLDRQYCDNELN